MNEIRIIAPAFSAKETRKEDFLKAEERLKKMNLTVSYGKNIFNKSNLLISNSANIEERIDDWNEAWSDKNVKYILGYNGGTNSNQILDSINWSIVKKSSAYFIGYSDLTVLENAIYTKTNKISYLGVNFAYLFRETVLDYTITNFEKALNNTEYNIYQSDKVNMNMWMEYTSKNF